MFLNKLIKIFNTFAFRLTVVFTGVFVIAFLCEILIIELHTTSGHKDIVIQEPLQEAKDFSFVLLLKGVEDFNTGIIVEAEPKEVGSVSYYVLSRDSETNGSSDISSWHFVSDESALQKFNIDSESFHTLLSTGNPPRSRIRYSIVAVDSSDKIIQLNAPANGHEYFVWRLGRTHKYSFALVIIFSGVVGWFMIK
ncbi:MAG: hypothetical protein JXA79_01860, partial [Deltaproteobacteria bacterium]|nr:hypothetical protein [Deltaproteobacteria bacterium]